MRTKIIKKMLSVIVSGSMIFSCIPSSVKAKEVVSEVETLKAVFSEATVGQESTLTLITDNDFDGKKNIKISNYIPKQEYVQDGLVLQLDGIDNVGTGTHESQAEYWVDLTDNTQIAINQDTKQEGEGNNVFTDKALQLNKSKVYLPDKVVQAVNGEAYTIEFVVDSDGYSGYETLYSPLMTMDGLEGTWGIFVWTPGKIMELKRSNDQKRLQTEFENVFDTTSAITFQADKESAWYANGEKKSTLESGNSVSVENVVLGGGMETDAYVTNASYRAIRIYDRVLSEAEIQQNASFDQIRYYDKKIEVPKVKINHIALREQGTTTVAAEFEDGVAVIPVESMEEGRISMDIIVDGISVNGELVTKETDKENLQGMMQQILQGEFDFDSDTEVTSENLQQQIEEKLDGDVATEIIWNPEKKCYELTLSKGEESLTCPLYVNSDVSISEFTEEFLENCTIRKGENSKVEIKNGAICANTDSGIIYENVVLPVFNYGRDYMLSVDMKVTDSISGTSWAALSYGVVSNAKVENNGWSFWQMAVRRDATTKNGVECATMNADGHWNVVSMGSYIENLNPGKKYNLKVLVKDKYVYEYLNDRLMVKYPVQRQMKYGKVAFTFNRLSAEYSDFFVTSEIPDNLETEFSEEESGYDTNIYEPVTGLVMAPAVISEDDGKTISNLISGNRRPSTIIRTVTNNMTVMDNQEEISLAEYIVRVRKKALVGFRIENMDLANVFASYVEENNLEDIMIISKDPQVLLAACNRRAGVHGMLDCSGYGGNPQMHIYELVSKANASNSRILVLPQQLATKENIQYIQARSISVWVKTKKEETLKVILNGAEGVLVEDFENAYDVIESFETNIPVLTRSTLITAHRGKHSQAPENTERAASLAVQAGADAIEYDVHLSKDGEVVVNHDTTTGRLMNKNLVIANNSLKKIQALTFEKNAIEGDKIPSLQEMFVAADLADTEDDVIHLIEIKTDDSRIIEPMVKIIKDMNMEERVVFISFFDEQLELVRQALPTVAAGTLNSVQAYDTDDTGIAMKKLCEVIDGYGYFYGGNYNSWSKRILQAARFRGIHLHPWTINDQNNFENSYIDNYHGITTDNIDLAPNYLEKVKVKSNTYVLQTGEANKTAIDAKAYTRKGTQIDYVNLTMKQISGVPVTWDAKNGVCHAEQEGEAVVLIGASYCFFGANKTYTVYSEPITLKYEKKAEESVEIAPEESFKKIKAKIKTLKCNKTGQINVNWKKVSGAKGYIVEYATKSNFKGKKKIKIEKGTTTSYKIKKLKNEKYYVRIRAYKTVDGEKIYTQYSGKKSIRVKSENVFGAY